MSNSNPHEIADILITCSANMEHEFLQIKQQIDDVNREAKIYEEEERQLLAGIAAKDHKIAELEIKIKALDVEHEDYTVQAEMQHETNEALFELYEAQQDCQKGSHLLCWSFSLQALAACKVLSNFASTFIKTGIFFRKDTLKKT